MHSVIRKYIIEWGGVVAIGASALTLHACSSRADEPLPEPAPELVDNRISWEVRSLGRMQQTKSLIESNESLQAACTPGVGGKAIGIWSAYQKNGAVSYNVLGQESDVSLTYENGTDKDNYQGWTYGEKAAQWNKGAIYYFNAYFPQTAITITTSSDETTFVARYNSRTTQEDLLLAYEEVDTNEPTFKTDNPVPLQMNHALAALRFEFLMNESGETDKLTGCWLENSETGKGLSTYGIFEFGVGGAGNAITWLPASNGYAEAGTAYYKWENTGGVVMGGTEDSDAENAPTAVAYTSSASTPTYAGNDGWLLIIPQESDGTATLCFTTENGGGTVQRVKLPKVTGTSSLPPRPNTTGTAFIPGYRYSYRIILSGPELKVTLSIKNWNLLESSADIVF